MGKEIQESHQSKLFVEPHLVSQHGAIVEQVWLHVAPHVGEPPELLHIGQQQVISSILGISTCRVAQSTLSTDDLAIRPSNLA
jgi:hypothetical protein